MTWPSTLAWCAASSAIVAVPLLIRLSAVNAQRDLYRTWWERDSAKMLIAQAQLDLIHQQHVDAGRKAHEPARALRRETTEKLIQCLASREPGSTQPATDPEPVMGFPAALSAGSSKSGRGRQSPQQSGQDTGAGILPDVTPWASDRNEPVDPCRRNRAGYSAPAEIPLTKGAI